MSLSVLGLICFLCIEHIMIISELVWFSCYETFNIAIMPKQLSFLSCFGCL